MGKYSSHGKAYSAASPHIARFHRRSSRLVYALEPFVGHGTDKQFPGFVSEASREWDKRIWWRNHEAEKSLRVLWPYSKIAARVKVILNEIISHPVTEATGDILTSLKRSSKGT